MLIQRYLKIHNGCQHKDVHVDFMPGSIYAVTGHNACGKTNFLQLNMYGLLGIVNKSWGSQKDLNRTGTKDGFVEVCLSDSSTGDVIYIRRHFTAGTKNPDRLWFHDTDHDPDIIGRDAIDTRLSSEYGVSPRILFELLYMRQGMANWLLTASATSIYTFLNSIFDTSKFKKIREVLMDAANNIALYEVDHARISLLESTINELNKAVYEDTSKYTDEISLLRDKLAELSSVTLTEDAKQKRLAALNSQLSDRRKALEKAQSEYDALNTNPVPWLSEEHHVFAKQYDDCHDQAMKIAEHLHTRNDKLNNYQADIRRTKSEIERLDRELIGVKGTMSNILASGNCPVCARHINDVKQAEKNLTNLLGNTAINAIESRLDQLHSELFALGHNYDDVNTDIESVTAKYNEYNKFLNDNKELRFNIGVAIEKHAKWNDHLKHKQVFLDAVTMALRACADTDAEIHKLSIEPVMSNDQASERNKILARIRELEFTVSAINSRKVADKTKLDSCVSELKLRNDARDKNKSSQDMYNRLMLLREGTANTHIPARYLNDKVSMLNSELEAYCRMADLNIILFLDPEDFVFRFTDGKDVRASGQLSGAQQTICSTILQLALVRVVGPRLGVIQMDEPTVFLDPINRSKLLTLFESMASVLSSSGTITIVPTHDVDLINSCNERIQL